MSSCIRIITLSGLAGLALVASPLASVAADNIPGAAAAPMVATPEVRRETVDQRIASLHTSLDITPSEESDWNGVTKAMRESAGVMEKLMAEKSAKGPASMTALDDLKTYQKFAEAHAEGLRKLTSSFARLYKSMPDAQKKVADQVFQDFGHARPESRG